MNCFLSRWKIVTGVWLCTTSLAGQSPSPSLVFKERVYQFGTIDEAKGKVAHTFEFVNKGKTPVTIDEVHSGCGCIGHVTISGPIPPGAKGKVTVTFDPTYRSGPFSKELVVLSQDRQHYNRIWVEGHIRPMQHPVADEFPYNFGQGLYMRFKVLAFGYVRPGATQHMELPFANDTDQDMHLEFLPQGNIPGLRFEQPGMVAPKGKGMVRFSYTMPMIVTSDQTFTLVPVVNRERSPETLDIRVLYDKGTGKGAGPLAAKPGMP